MMVPNDRNHRIGEVNTAEDLRSYRRVNLHLVEFRGSEPSRLIQDMRRNGELADIVKQSPSLQRGDFFLWKTKDLTHAHCVKLYPTDMTMCCLILGVDC